MPSVTKYPGTITQATGTTIVSYTGLNNLKNNSATYAKTGLIGAKTDTKKNPPTIKCTNFGFNLPDGSEVTSIVVEYAHQRTAYNSKYPSIGKNTVKILGAGLGDYGVKEHSSPAKTLTAKTVTFNGKLTVPSQTLPFISATGKVSKKTVAGYTEYYNLPGIGKVNSSDFGVSIDYPPNTSVNKGYLQLKYIRITINYKITEYSLSVKQLSDELVVGTPAVFGVTINNINLTKYSPTITITIPSGTTLYSNGGDGHLYQDGARKLIWRPAYLTGEVISSASHEIALLLPEGQKTIQAVEGLTSASSQATFTVSATPTGAADEEGISEQTVYCYENVPKTITITIPEAWKSETDTIYIQPDTYIIYEGQGEIIIPIPVSSFDENNSIEFTFTVDPESLLEILSVAPNSTDFNNSYYIKAIPLLCKPYFDIITLTADELDRLGNDFTYNISCYFELNGDISNTFTDYYRNFRLGVVNNTLAADPSNIFESCNNWSGPMTVYNSWEEKNVDFTYNEDYPVHILITGDFDLDSTFQLDFSEVCITETDSVEGFAEGVNIPEPIEYLITDGENANLDIPAFTTTNLIVLYEPLFGEGFGTNEDMAIHGIEVGLDIETNDNIICSATLKGPNGESGSESILIDSNNSEYTIGGKYDLFGLKVSDMEELSEWEIDLAFTNNNSEEVDVIINKIDLTAYYVDVTPSNETVTVDGENLAWYNAFLDNVKIPMGLETDTEYVTVKGADVNKASLMNVRGKEIEIDITIDGCDLTETQEMASQLMKLLTNERDDLNRPIPKIVEFSFVPNEYFEYVKEDASDSAINISDYELKIKLQVPSGTSFANDETVTGASGVVNSITKINPVINVVPSSDVVEIIEEKTGQQFNMGYSGWVGKYVAIDCENRTITVRDEEDDEPTDISYAGDMNNDWFSLNSSFIFKCTGCVLQNVTWVNRS